MDSKDLVSVHACERYIERILKINIENDISIDTQKLCGITRVILKIINECHPGYLEFGKGSFHCSEYNCVLVVEDGVIVTVKEQNKEPNREYAGGILKGGTKAKKRQVSKLKHISKYGKIDLKE